MSLYKNVACIAMDVHYKFTNAGRGCATKNPGIWRKVLLHHAGVAATGSCRADFPPHGTLHSIGLAKARNASGWAMPPFACCRERNSAGASHWPKTHLPPKQQPSILPARNTQGHAPPLALRLRQIPRLRRLRPRIRSLSHRPHAGRPPPFHVHLHPSHRHAQVIADERLRKMGSDPFSYSLFL